MSITIPPKGNYSHREYSNDIKLAEDNSRYTFEGQCKRLTTAALPFLSLYAPLSMAINIGSNSMRVWTNANKTYNCSGYIEISMQGIQTIIATSSLLGSVFFHPVGMIMTTGQDIAMEYASLYQYYRQGNTQAIIASTAKIFNNTLYLAVLTKGGLELTLASLCIQTGVGLYQSFDELSKGNIIEGIGHLGMSVLRSGQCKSQLEAVQFYKKMKRSTPLTPSETETKDQVIFNIIQKLKDILTNDELVYITGKANSGEIVSADCLWMFANAREKKDSFSSQELRTIIETFSKHNSNWQGIEIQDLFWLEMHERAFGNIYNHLSNENGHANYEARRIFTQIKHVYKEYGPLIPKAFILNLLDESLIGRDTRAGIIESKLWETSYQYVYRKDKIFKNKSWEENFEIAHDTRGFAQSLSKTEKPDITGKDLENLIDQYPKTSEIHLEGYWHIWSPSIVKTLDKCNGTLKELSIVKCGIQDYNGQGSEWAAVNIDTIEAIAKCESLEKLKIEKYFLLDKSKAAHKVKTGCPKLKELIWVKS